MRRLTERKRFSLLLIVVLIGTSFTTMGTAAQADNPATPPEWDRAAPGQPPVGAPTGAVSPEGLLNPDGTLDLSAGFQGTLDLQGWDVTLDGERGPVLSPASPPDTPSGPDWHPLANQGLDGDVYALAVDGSDLYVGGDFNSTDDNSLRDLGNIARYDMLFGTWHALPNRGLDRAVNALALVGSDLYVGGDFSQSGDGSLTDLYNIARYDTATHTWHPLPNQGLKFPNYHGEVNALAVIGGDLYVGGFFDQTGDGSLTDLKCMARYDTTAGTWHALPLRGYPGTVSALAVNGPDLYVAVFFVDMWGSEHHRLQRYDTTAGVWDYTGNVILDARIHALAVIGTDVYLGGGFSETWDGSLTGLGGIVRYDTIAGTWHALPNQGFDLGGGGKVSALVVAGSDLYVGGQFPRTGDGSLADLGNIARYDIAADTWYPLANGGLNGGVRALAVVGSDLYVGGGFSQTGDGSLTHLGHVARYDPFPGSGHGLPNQGLDNEVLALAVVGSDLYVGGGFTHTGDWTLTDLGYIARYDTVAGAWHALPNQGLDGGVYALAAAGSDLYVGGDFSQTGDGSLTNLGRIARYDTAAGTWHGLPNGGLGPHRVYALTVVGSDLYVGGGFDQTGDGSLTNLGHIVRYDTVAGTWHALPNQGLDDYVYAVAVVGNDLCVGGDFAGTGDGLLANLGSIARYDTLAGAWHALPNQGLDGGVLALAAVGSDLYVGGWFDSTGDGSLTELGFIARYDTVAGTWHALPNGGLDNGYTLPGHVDVLTLAGDDLYVGGLFHRTGDLSLGDLGNIVRYDTVAGTWHPLPNQGLVTGFVYALAMAGSDLYVGGVFHQTGDGSLIGLGNVARFDSGAGTWRPLPNQGLNGVVRALATVGDDLYAGGDFVQSCDGSLVFNHIARYDTVARTWHTLPNQGLNGPVHALAVVGEDLYVGGSFNQTGGETPTNLGNIVRYDTVAGTWHALPNGGLNGTVRALAVIRDDLYVGGDFSQSGDGSLALSHIARYDIVGDAWYALPNGGLDGAVWELEGVGDNLYAGGDLTQTGDGSLANLGHIARYDTRTGTWYALPNGGLNSRVEALVRLGSDLYAGGAFTGTGDGSLLLNHIARYDLLTGTWHALAHMGQSVGHDSAAGHVSAPQDNGLDGAVYVLAVVGSDLYVGGDFSQSGDGTVIDLGNIARYDLLAGTWNALPDQGLNGAVHAMAVDGSNLYLGGEFTQTGDGTVTHLGRIGRVVIRGMVRKVFLPLVVQEAP